MYRTSIEIQYIDRFRDPCPGMGEQIEHPNFYSSYHGQPPCLHSNNGWDYHHQPV